MSPTAITVGTSAGIHSTMNMNLEVHQGINQIKLVIVMESMLGLHQYAHFEDEI